MLIEFCLSSLTAHFNSHKMSLFSLYYAYYVPFNTLFELNLLNSVGAEQPGAGWRGGAPGNTLHLLSNQSELSIVLPLNQSESIAVCH
jgi:hypothetical protein